MRRLIKWVIPVSALLCICVQRSAAQVFVLRDLNQELLGLVANIADGYDEKNGDSPIHRFEEYCRLYSGMRDWIEGTEAVQILRELLKSEVVDRNDLPALAVVYRSGFTALKEDYLLPSFMSPMNGAAPYFQRLVECLRQLALDERFTSYMESGYGQLYRRALDGSEAMFDETGQVIVMIEEMLGIPPPENFLNFFTLFSTPHREYSGMVEKTDGSRITYVVNGIGYDSEEREVSFEISPELFFNTYAFGVVENARLLNPGYDGEFYRLYTPRIRETAESVSYYQDIDTYMLANVSNALTAYMFGGIGNRALKNMIIGSQGDYYLYCGQIVELLENDFKGSGLSFYEYFPRLFGKLQPVQ